MNFLPEIIENYVAEHTRYESEVLKKLNRETHSRIMMPQMLSGHVQGSFLKMLSCMVNPMQVLEVGTFTGYSAICLAEGLKEGGMIHTIDINEELTSMAKRYIVEAGLKDKITTYIGNALDIIPKLNHEFDLVFIDADKNNYCNYFELAMKKLRKGGFILADNVLWSGKIVDTIDKNDKETLGIVAFNEMIQKDKRVENVLVPIRDGMMIARKVM